MTTPPLICIALCAGAFGVRGEVRVKSFTDQAQDCFSYGPLRRADGEVLLKVVSFRPVKNAFAAVCQGIETPEQADGLKNTKLYVRRTDLPAPETDEFYFEDLIGLAVKTTDGKRMGEVMAVHDFGAGTMLEISGTDKTANFFHAFNKKTVPIVDINAGRVVIFIEEVVIAKE